MGVQSIPKTENNWIGQKFPCGNGSGPERAEIFEDPNRLSWWLTPNSRGYLKGKP